MEKNSRHSLPEKFVERLQLICGSENFRQIHSSFHERPTTFRVNTIKSTREKVLETLRSEGFKLQLVNWYRNAFVLQNKSKRELGHTEMYRNGEIYMQSLASMVPPLLMDLQPGQKVLDLTAAPGSKTSQIAAILERQGELVANELNKVRFFKLKHNMELLGVAGDDDFLKLRMEDGGKLCFDYPEYFDRILLDAPCSAESRFIEGDLRSYGFWKEMKIKDVAYKQRKLLLAAWAALKPGGILVYSTCTFAPEENEMQVMRLIERNPEQARLMPAKIDGLRNLPILGEWKREVFSKEINNCLRIFPTKDIEGFFVAKIRKVA